jgi:hypothetical protein
VRQPDQADRVVLEGWLTSQTADAGFVCRLTAAAAAGGAAASAAAGVHNACTVQLNHMASMSKAIPYIVEGQPLRCVRFPQVFQNCVACKMQFREICVPICDHAQHCVPHAYRALTLRLDWLVAGARGRWRGDERSSVVWSCGLVVVGPQRTHVHGTLAKAASVQLLRDRFCTYRLRLPSTPNIDWHFGSKRGAGVALGMIVPLL